MWSGAKAKWTTPAATMRPAAARASAVPIDTRRVGRSATGATGAVAGSTAALRGRAGARVPARSGRVSCSTRRDANGLLLLSVGGPSSNPEELSGPRRSDCPSGRSGFVQGLLVVGAVPEADQDRRPPRRLRDEGGDRQATHQAGRQLP